MALPASINDVYTMKYVLLNVTAEAYDLCFVNDVRVREVRCMHVIFLITLTLLNSVKFMHTSTCMLCS